MLRPGAVCHTPTSSSECGYGKGFSSTPSKTLNTTVFAPTPAASVISVITVNIGARPSLRRTWRNWFLNSLIGTTLLVQPLLSVSALPESIPCNWYVCSPLKFRKALHCGTIRAAGEERKFVDRARHVH